MCKQFEKQKLAYKKTIEKALIFSLFFFLLLLHIFPKRVEQKATELPPLDFKFEIEEIPVTEQRVRRGRRPPQKPVIPVASEDPDIPPDATIDETLLDWEAGDDIAGQSGITSCSNDMIPPRPIVQVLPEYPKELQKQNVRGIVKVRLYVNEKGEIEEAVISENTTNSEACAEAALAAAKKSTYLPASAGGEKIATWVTCTYSFEPD